MINHLENKSFSEFLLELSCEGRPSRQLVV